MLAHKYKIDKEKLTSSRTVDDKLNRFIELEDVCVLIRAKVAHFGRIVSKNVEQGRQVRCVVGESVDSPLHILRLVLQ